MKPIEEKLTRQQAESVVAAYDGNGLAAEFRRAVRAAEFDHDLREVTSTLYRADYTSVSILLKSITVEEIDDELKAEALAFAAMSFAMNFGELDFYEFAWSPRCNCSIRVVNGKVELSWSLAMVEIVLT
jgi:hypothetical protein